MPKPDFILASILKEYIQLAWKDVPPPDVLMRYRDPGESDRTEKYFSGRAISDVNLNDQKIRGELIPLHYMTLQAVHYYIQAYLREVIDVDSNEGTHECGMVFIHVMGCLCDPSTLDHPRYTRQQILAILGVLKFVENSTEYYLIIDEERLGVLWNGIERWTKKYNESDGRSE
jgi:hypothetical protein